MAFQGYHKENRYGEMSSSAGKYSLQRKVKRTIPDSDKDERYWEKRKRNNMAAKKSRENKRIADAEIRKTVLLLEQENALLKKEVGLLKAEIGIPNGHSILTAEQRSECLQQVAPLSEGFKKETDENALSPGYRSDTQYDTYISPNLKSPNNLKCNEELSDESPGMKDYNCSMEKMNQQMAIYGPLNAMLWAAAPVKYPSKTSCNRDIYAGRNFPYYLPYSASRFNKSFDSDSGVMDASAIDQNNRNEVNSTGSRKLYTGYSNYMSDITSRNIPLSYADDKQNDENLVKENQDLKRKLLLLSSQFQEMKNIVCVD